MLDVSWAPMLGAFSVLFEEFGEGDAGLPCQPCLQPYFIISSLPQISQHSLLEPCCHGHGRPAAALHLALVCIEILI